MATNSAPPLLCCCFCGTPLFVLCVFTFPEYLRASPKSFFLLFDCCWIPVWASMVSLWCLPGRERGVSFQYPCQTLHYQCPGLWPQNSSLPWVGSIPTHLSAKFLQGNSQGPTLQSFVTGGNCSPAWEHLLSQMCSILFLPARPLSEQNLSLRSPRESPWTLQTGQSTWIFLWTSNMFNSCLLGREWCYPQYSAMFWV